MRVKAELDQMREGLKLHGFLRYMEEYPSLMQKLFVPGEDYNVRASWMTPALFFIFVKFSFLPFNHLCCLCPSLSLEDFAIQRDEHLSLLIYLDSYVPHNQSLIISPVLLLLFTSILWHIIFVVKSLLYSSLYCITEQFN